MSIPKEAIDAAAAAIIVTEGRTENIRALATRIVNAAAPFIAAQSLREAANELPDYDLPFMVNGRGAIHPAWALKDRAAELEAPRA